MKQAIALIFGVWLAVFALASGAVGQGIGPQLPGAETSGMPDYDAWQRVAIRAERASEAGISSTFALERMRAEIVTWRDEFLTAEGINSSRIATVRAQIEALGPAPADGSTEDSVIASRRADLNSQLARLRSPVILAQEAYAQANGLISEIDRMVRERQTEKLTTRGNSPLNPASWSTAVITIWSASSMLLLEFTAGLKSDMASGELWRNLPRSLFILAVGVLLLLRSKTWIARAQAMVASKVHIGEPVWMFLLSLGNIILPYLGLLAVSASMSSSGVLGFRGLTMVQALPDAGLFVIAANWLSAHFFGPSGGPLGLADHERAKGRRYLRGLSWTLAIGALFIQLISTGDNGGISATVLVFPVECILGLFLYRLGRLLAGLKGAEKATVYRDRTVSVVGRIAMVVAVVGPVLAAGGYAAAAEALLYPAVTTMAILAAVMLLQRLVFDIYGMFIKTPEGGQDALLPLLVGFVLLFLSLPVIALVWGAKEADLFEVWTRFREGFSIGETRISPTDFITFAAIFAIGYMITRLIQGTLRTTVLPKTRIDIGGQNAIVAGLGYVGMFLAALVAITAAGIDLSSLAIVAGALSVGIGFGLQNIVSNFVSGIILLIERPISEGDWIEVGGQMGYVRDISVRSTRIETFDRTDVIIPNADLVSGQVTNWTRGNSVGRIIVPVGVAYGTDTEMVTGLLREIAEAHPMVLLQPPPNVVFMGFGADSLDFEIRAIVRDVNFGLNTKSEMNHQIAKKFAQAGIEIPFAQRDIWLRNPEVLQPKPAPRKGRGTPPEETPA